MPSKLAVLFEQINSKYNVLSFGNQAFATELKKQGHLVFFEIEKWLKFRKKTYKKIAFVRGSLTNKASLLKRIEQAGHFVVNRLADHPYYYFGIGQCPPHVIPMLLDNTWANSLHWDDRSQAPHYGLISPASGLQSNQALLKINNRPLPLLWATSFTEPKQILLEYTKKYPLLSNAFKALESHSLNSHNDFLIDHFLRQHLFDLLALTSISKDDVPKALNALRQMYHFMDKYQRQLMHVSLLEALQQSQVETHIYSNSAVLKEKYAIKHMHFHAEIDYQAYIDLNTQAKMVLSNTYQNGQAFFSERIPTAMLNGAVAASYKSPLIEHLVSPKQVILSDSQMNLAERSQQYVSNIEKALMDEDDLQQRANLGRQQALNTLSIASMVRRLVTELDSLNLPHW